MAQYFVDFTDSGVYTVGQFPPGFTPRYSGTTASSNVVSLTTPSGSQALRMTEVGNATYAGLSLDAVDSDPNRADVEIVARYSVQDAAKNNALNLFARGEGTQRANAYFCHAYSFIGPNSDSKSIRDRIDGVGTTIASTAIESDAGIWYWVRVRVNGDQIKAKFWTDGESEPATWTLEGVTTRLTDGWVGLVTGSFTSVQNGVVDIDLFGIGTGGDSAPVSASADTTAPTLTSPTGTPTGATTANGTVSTNEGGGTLYWLASANATETGAAVKAGSSQAVSETGPQAVTVSGLTASTAYYLHYLHRDAAGNDSAVVTSAQFTTGAAGPPPAGAVTISAVDPGVTSVVVTYSYSDTDQTGFEYRIYNGAPTTLGASPATISGLIESTGYEIQVRAINADGTGAWSSVSSFTTDAAPVTRGISLMLHAGSTPQANITAIRALWWDAIDPTGAPAYSTSTAITSAEGVLTLNLDASTSLGIGEWGFLLLYKLNGTDHRDSLTFAGQVQIVDVS